MPVTYTNNCKNCDKLFIGKIGRRLTTRISEHKDNIDKKPKYHNVISKHIIAKKRLHESDFDPILEKVQILKVKSKNWWKTG